MRRTWLLLSIAASISVTACADFYSIGRTTTLPGGTASRNGLAIHLDAQQRVVMVGRNGVYCAEPSPDAMAAYAQASALGVSIPSQGAGSGANASQSEIAGIGLRTQSITLMRDALYRLCEAGANDQLTAISQTQLMARSQDLTAVVVAVEQLTGAVAANQAILTSNANASSAASLMSNAESVAQARKYRDDKKTELATAQADQKNQSDIYAAQKLKSDGADAKYKEAAGKTPPPSDLADLQAASVAEGNALATEKGKLDVENTKVDSATKALSDAEATLAALSNQNSTALTQANASTGGGGQFSAVVPRVQLDKEATKEVANSVQTMVTTVLNKDYTGADCMFLLTNMASMQNQDRELLKTTVEQCKTLLEAKINSETAKYLTLAPATYRPPDVETNRIRAAIHKDSTLVAKMNADLASYGNITVFDVLNNSGQISGVDPTALVNFLIEKYHIP